MVFRECTIYIYYILEGTNPHKLRYNPYKCGALATYNLNCTTKRLERSNFWKPNGHLELRIDFSNHMRDDICN